MGGRTGRGRRALAILAVTLAVLLVAAAAPIVLVETGCGAGLTPRATPAPRADIPDAGYRRAPGDSFLTYPEWYIVHAYADLAGVTRQGSESAFGYGTAIWTFWSSLCRATEVARQAGPVTLDQRVTNYVIGLSFTLEMAVQGAYERSIGALTAWARGATKTPEDAFNQRFLDDYVAFLGQTPWYRYPFAGELGRLWRETPWATTSWTRSLERRLSLSLQYGAKSLYAVGIGALADAAPAELTIMSVVRGAAATATPGVTLVRSLPDGSALVRTPRYEAFTVILRAWAAGDGELVGVAGTDRILITALARDGAADPPGARRVFAIPLQSRPGWERVGLDVKAATLLPVLRALGASGAEFEHAYDP
ncbi:MAG: hypothetical protein JO048_03860 [Methylobacteriaceae bacterium]|nr:hypothetical protein [Methylobacteriaceae bacterium]